MSGGGGEQVVVEFTVVVKIWLCTVFIFVHFYGFLLFMAWRSFSRDRRGEGVSVEI